MKNQVQIIENPSFETYKVYKIRRKSDGLFSTGGHFNEIGKSWRKLSGVGNHIGEVVRDAKWYGGSSWCQDEDDLIGNYEIVTYEYELKKTEVATESVSDYHAGLVRRREKRTANAAKASAKQMLELAKRELQQATEKLAKLQGGDV